MTKPPMTNWTKISQVLVVFVNKFAARANHTI